MLHSTKFQFACFAVALAVAMLSISASAQVSDAAPPASVGESLRSLASRAGVAFAGQVISIERKAGAVEIVFRVDQPILGSPSSTYILREWAGLWPPGQHRYVVGQHVLIFLHPTGSAGLSSPVGGMTGIIPIASTNAGNAQLLDVRRLAAGLERAEGQPLPSVSTSAISLAEAEQLVSHWSQPLRREPIRLPLPLPQPPLSPVALPAPLPPPTFPRPISQLPSGTIQ